MAPAILLIAATLVFRGLGALGVDALETFKASRAPRALV
jgi:hypothetical protein